MATQTDEIKIDLDAIDDAPKVKKNGAAEPAIKVEPKPAPADPVVLKPEDGLAKLQKQLDDERSAREAAERDAQEARQNEVNARAQSQGDQLALVTTALESVKTSQKGLKADYAAALAAQDFEKVAEIQEQMSDNSARMIQLDAGKKQLEKAPKPVARQPTDMVEQFVSTMTPQSASWVRSHPEYVRDPKLNRRMIRAHEDAIDEGVKADTPEYFASIEKTLGLTQVKVDDTPAGDDALSGAAAATSRRSPPAAPVSRGGNGTGSRPNVVTLSADEVEMAKATGQTPEEYARNKMALRKEGRLN
jgi:hypothetical protein